jgi:hypothetical protein
LPIAIAGGSRRSRCGAQTPADRRRSRYPTVFVTAPADTDVATALHVSALHKPFDEAALAGAIAAAIAAS